ncbi:MAG: hypothetical protein GKR89_29415 [Candidatus Latescibacteria bacterium]|nr:hypothetical protein [Candidatus Latescibacterota bacterium]
MRLIKNLPDPFILQEGRRVASIDDWHQRRAQIKDMMLNMQYGTMPGPPEKVTLSTVEQQPLASGAVGEKLRFEFTPQKDRPDLTFTMEATAWHPAPDALSKRREQIPAFAANGVPTCIYVGDNHCAPLLDKGYRVICYDNSQLEPMEMGRPIVGPARTVYRQLEPERYSWGSISVWAWGALRLVDYALSLPDTDPGQIAISGHSRNGKTALLAGALDERIGLVNPSGSGCAGAGSYLALGEKCEDLAALTSRQRWWAWTHANFEQWAGREEDLPFDQHFLMGLVAPRPLLRSEGTTDGWANPEGTCIAFLATQPIYDFLGIPDRNGIYFHEGGHDHTDEDLTALAAFADAHFFAVPHEINFARLLRDKTEFPPAFEWTMPLACTNKA